MSMEDVLTDMAIADYETDLEGTPRYVKLVEVYHNFHGDFHRFRELHPRNQISPPESVTYQSAGVIIEPDSDVAFHVKIISDSDDNEWYVDKLPTKENRNAN